MKRSKRLQTVIDIQVQQENDALLLLQRSQQQLQDQQLQLANLQRYRQEYLDQLGERQQLGMNISQLLEFRAFADKLNKAIDAQGQAMVRQERDVQRAQIKWKECHQRTKSLQRLCELAIAEELKIQNKREQSEQDARATRASRKNGLGSA